MKTLWAVLIGVSVAFGGAGAGAQVEKEIRLDIQSQALPDALNEWAQAAGFRLIGPAAATRHLPSPRLQGTFTPQAALARLLAGTSLTYEFLDERTVAIHEPLPASPPAPTPVAGKQQGSHILRLTGTQVDEAPRSGDRIADSENRVGSPANAGEPTNNKRQRSTLEEVIVTAQKREQSVKDVPISMAVLVGDDLGNAGISNISEMTYSVPGLSSVEVGPGFQNITIRGVGNLRGSASLIGLYLDEAAVAGANEQQIDLRLFDLARVEVLRGPQGTLYGEGSMGGTIRYITNDPELDDFTGNLEVSAFDTYKGGMSEVVRGVANVPLVKDKFGIRIAATYEDTSGWIDQPTANREDINNSDLSNIRVKSLWRVNEDFSIKGTAIVHRNEGDGYNYVNGPKEDSSYIPALNPTLVTPYEDNYEHYGLTLDYDLGFASLISASSYTDMDKFTLQSFYIFNLPAGSPPDGFSEFTNQDVRFVTQELRLTSADAERLRWTIGAFYRDAENSNVADFNFNGFLFSGDTLESSESLAFFGDAEYSLTDRVTIGAGARYFEDRQSQADHLAGTKFRETFSTFSPRGYISFAATQSVNAYASVSKGFRSGGFNNAAAIALGAPVGFDPEVLWTYEVGTKMDLLNGRVDADLAFFYSEYDDYVGTGVVPGSTIPLGQLFNTGTVEIRGVEWAFVWNALDNVRLGINGNVVDAEITKITAINPASIVGDKPDNTPSHEYSIFLDSSFDWSENVVGFLRMNYNVQGKMYFHARDSRKVEKVDNSDPVEFLDVHFGAQWDRWTAELFATNVLDEVGFVTAYTSYGSAAQARRRSVGVKIGAKF